MSLYTNLVQWDWNLSVGEHVAFVRYPFGEILELDPIFRITNIDFQKETTTNLRYNATALEVQNALRALSSSLSGIIVTGNAALYTITFINGGIAQDLFTYSNSLFAPIQATLTVIKRSVSKEIQTVSLGGATSGTFNLIYNGVEITTNLRYNATALEVQNALNALPSLSDVLVTGDAKLYTITFVSVQPILTSINNLSILSQAEIKVVGSPGIQNKVQTLSLGGATEGTFKLSYTRYAADIVVVESSFSFLTLGTTYLGQPLNSLRRVKLSTISPTTLTYTKHL